MTRRSPQASSLARAGRTVFQLKTGDFKPQQPAAIHNELFGPKVSTSKDELGDAVRECMDTEGSYVLVCTGTDLVASERSRAMGHLRTEFHKCGYSDPYVDVLSQNQLVAILQSLPSLSLKINGNGGGHFETYWRWADHDQMRLPFKPGEFQDSFMEGLVEKLREDETAVHIHVRGEAGIGKTRLVLEALRRDDLAPLVIYCDGPSRIRDSDLLVTLRRDDNLFALVLVVDECDPDTRFSLWNTLKHVGPRVKFVSIYTDADSTSGSTIYITAPPLKDDQIIDILGDYLPAAESAHRWADFCSGSPRVAHVVGLNLRHNPEDLLKSPDTVNVWDKYIVGTDHASSDDVRQRVTVLRRLALFKRFGFQKGLVHEAKTIAALCEKDDPAITWARFETIVHELKSRKILQGESTLYITPKLLHIKLWVDWWSVHGNSFDPETLFGSLPPTLLDWFFEMARYAERSRAAQTVFESLLGEDGPFQRGDLLRDPRGARFFLALTEATPAVALRSVTNTVGRWSVDDLRAFTTGRRELVWALERIAVWRDLFEGAAGILLKLAEAENERDIDNNATGVFVGLFSPAPGAVAPTEAPPEQRFPMLKEALEHESKDCRMVALRACEVALQTSHFSRAVGPEHQGLRPQPELWTPKTWGEWFDAYRRVWHLVEDRIDQMPPDEQRMGLEVLLNNARGVAQVANLATMVTETLGTLPGRPYVDERQIIKVVEDMLRYDAGRYEPDVRAECRRLRERLVTDDYHSLMRRYVGMDLRDDKITREGVTQHNAHQTVESLAEQAVEEPQLVRAELPWLVTDDAQNGYRFGHQLGFQDETSRLLPDILRAQRHASTRGSVLFLGGYLRALKERDEETWEQQMDAMASDVVLRLHVPEVTWRSGLTDRAAARILRLAVSGAVTAQAFRCFSYGGVIEELTEERFTEWVEFLLGVGVQDAVACAVDFCYFYYVEGARTLSVPEDLVFRVLTAPALFVSADNRRNITYEEYEWTEVASAYVDQHPERSVEVAARMLAHFGERGTIVGAYESQTHKVLKKVLTRFPIETWNHIATCLGPPIDTRAFHIYQWLSEGPLALVPADAVWHWVEKDSEKRAWYVATFVPQVFPGTSGTASAREILVRYGGREDVRRNLIANFSSGMWEGPQSRHLEARLEEIGHWRNGERNANVGRWLDEYASSVSHDIERAKIEEERRF